MGHMDASFLAIGGAAGTWCVLAPQATDRPVSMRSDAMEEVLRIQSVEDPRAHANRMADLLQSR